jgi:hypothetical protein
MNNQRPNQNEHFVEISVENKDEDDIETPVVSGSKGSQASQN